MVDYVSGILKRTKVPVVLAMAGFLLCTASPPVSAESVGEGPLKRNGWTISLVPYLWALSLDGELELLTLKSDVEVPFREILKELNAALMAEFVVHKGRFGLFINPLYAELKSEMNQTILEGTILQRDVNVDAKLKMLILSFGAGYRLGPYPLCNRTHGRTPAVIVEPYLGGRWTDMDVKLDVTLLSTRSFEDDVGWADPILGVMTAWDLFPRWNLLLSGDVGGFGVGTDLAWSVTCLAGYRFHFSKRIMGNAQLGYRALYQDFESGSGAGFKYDTTMHGPMVALDIGFGQW